jgi:alpha-L-rhamnosidase
MRTFLSRDPFEAHTDTLAWTKRGMWACRWIRGADPNRRPPWVMAFRCRFEVDEPKDVLVHVTADERYVLFLNGKQIGRGSERGDKNLWYFESYTLTLQPGENMLVAQVWALGKFAPYAQMSVEPGFLLCPDSAEWQQKIGTGIAAWDCKLLPGYTFLDPNIAWGTGANVEIDGSLLAWDFERGAGEDWEPVTLGEWASTAKRNDRPPTQLLTPATLPPMLEEPKRPGTIRHVSTFEGETTGSIPILAADNLADEQAQWRLWLANDCANPLTVPPYTTRRILLDLENYFCAYPVVTVSGGKGASVRVHWQESLYVDPRKTVKGNRDEIEGKYFVNVWSLKDGTGDIFLPDGGDNRTFTTLWWQCGRYVEIVIRTQDEPLLLHDFHLNETRYPFENEAEFSSRDGTPFDDIFPLAVRTWQMCAHETYMDCPFFEQLQYIGDTRIQCLVSYVLSSDRRLPRKALEMFAASLMHSGLTQSRYPSRVDQTIPPFSLWFIGMVHDYALWNDDLSFVRSLMPTVRRIIDTHLANVGDDGLFHSRPGWNTLDWVPEWKDGVPPDGDDVSGVLNLQLRYALYLTGYLELLLEEKQLSDRLVFAYAALERNIIKAFWNNERELFADNRAQTQYSEHAQCFALLASDEDAVWVERCAESLVSASDLSRATIYFSHYLFEAYSAQRYGALVPSRLNLWQDLKANGLRTTIEMPEPTRSDCHAWGAHAIYHAFASTAGIRPAGLGFRTVQVMPQLGFLSELSVIMPHPRGEIKAEYQRKGDRLHCRIELPTNTTGYVDGGQRLIPLVPGVNTVDIPAERPE